MKTYFTATVSYNRLSSVSTHADSLALALARAVADCCYLRTVGHQSQTVEVTECCATCGNVGRVRGKRKLSWKTCPDCKGKPIADPIRFPFVAPQSVEFSHNGKTDDVSIPAEY